MPGDKSVSHRAVMLGAISPGPVHVRGFGASADTLSTVAAVEALGVEVERAGETDLVVHGAGLRGLRAPAEPVDVGNAGTLIRLLPGILAGQVARSSSRATRASAPGPMERIAEPLRRMGVAHRDDRRPAADPDRRHGPDRCDHL